MNMKLCDILTCEAMRARKPDDQCLVDGLSVRQCSQAAQNGLSWLGQTVAQIAHQTTGPRPGYPDHSDTSPAGTGR